MEKCEALSDEWLLQDLERAPKSYSSLSCGNCSVTFHKVGNECSCCEEMKKCTESLSDEWVPQGMEATKCLTLDPAFNTHCVWHLGSTELLIKKTYQQTDSEEM